MYKKVVIKQMLLTTLGQLVKSINYSLHQRLSIIEVKTTNVVINLHGSLEISILQSCVGQIPEGDVGDEQYEYNECNPGLQGSGHVCA